MSSPEPEKRTEECHCGNRIELSVERMPGATPDRKQILRILDEAGEPMLRCPRCGRKVTPPASDAEQAGSDAPQ